MGAAVLDQHHAHVGAGLDVVLREIAQHDGVGAHDAAQHQQADERAQIGRVAGRGQGGEGAGKGEQQREEITKNTSNTKRITRGTRSEMNRTTIII
jgi:hypothetical protein